MGSTALLNTDRFFWKKKEIVSYLLSVLVFLLHLSSFAQYPETDSLIGVINEGVAFFFKRSITFMAVPLFFILSGATFFRDYDNSKYLKKIKSRVKTLLVPYLIWNTLWMLFAIICSYSFISSFFIGRAKFEFSIINILKGIFFYQYNGPFWFIFDLMIFVLASPLIELVVRNQYIGIISVLLLSVLQVFGIGLPTSIFFNSSAIIYYLIGAIIGKHYFHLFSQKSSPTMQKASLIFLLAVIVLKNIIRNRAYPAQLFVQPIVFALCGLCLWNVFDMFVERLQERPLYSRSFAVYALHHDVGAVITKLIAIVLPNTSYLAFPNYIASVILTLTVINLFCVVLERYLPSVYTVLMGMRVRTREHS